MCIDGKKEKTIISMILVPSVGGTPVPTSIPCSISIAANKDSFFQGMAMSFSGYSSESSVITLSIRGSGLPSEPVVFGQTYPSPTTQSWIYVWNPTSLSGYSIQPGQYTITATNLCGARDSVAVKIERGYVTIIAFGDQSYNVGETITFSGTCTSGNTVQLVMTGKGLPSTGVTLTTLEKNADHSWSYQWTVPSSIGGYTISAGTYTAFAYDSTRKVFGSVSILLKPQNILQPSTGSLNATSSPSAASVYVDKSYQGITPSIQVSTQTTTPAQTGTPNQAVTITGESNPIWDRNNLMYVILLVFVLLFGALLYDTYYKKKK
jgi:hypothetical protein